MKKIFFLFCFSFFLFGCHKSSENKVSRVPLEESESFYLSQVPKKIQVVNESLFLLERYHQSIGVYNISTGKIAGLFGLDNIDLHELYGSIVQIDSLVWEYDSIINLSYFIEGNRIENFVVQEDTVRIVLSLSIPYHDSDKSKNAYRYWYRHNFIVAYDLKSNEYSWRRLDKQGYDDTKIAVGHFSNLYVAENYLITPVNLVNDTSTKVMVLKKEGEHVYKYHGLIPLKNTSSIELLQNLTYSEIINNQTFIQINSTNQKFYKVLVDKENQLSLQPYNISDEVVLDRYFPTKLKRYNCINPIGDTILSLDWSSNSVPFVLNDKRKIFYINYQNEKYSLHIVPF